MNETEKVWTGPWQQGGQQLRKPPAAPSFLVNDPDSLSLDARLERQLHRARRQEYETLGTLEVVMVEASGVVRTNGNPLIEQKRSASIDWYSTGPLVGISLDHQELIICPPVKPPPTVPDPRFLPGKYDDEAPHVGQDLRNVAAGELKSADGLSDFLIFQPVHQLLLISRQESCKGFISVRFEADHVGRHCCMLYSAALRRAHLLYGHFSIKPTT